MAFLNWNDSLSVKIKEFDDQHKQLFEILKELFVAMTEGKGNKVIAKVLRDLKSYTISHFRNEEKFFEKYDYPDMDTQKKEHQYFIAKIESYIQELENGKISLPFEVSKFLNNWIKNHIIAEDKKYSAFFIEKGLV